jgi:hypothetical protein
MSKVTVHQFKTFDVISGETKKSASYATLAVIKEIKGTLIEGSFIEIEESMLDGNGMYKPKAE